jgi:hypothetical protein
VLDALTFGWSVALVVGVHIPPRPARPATDSMSDGEGFLTEALEGFRAIRGSRDLVLVTAATSAQTLVRGASTVFMVVMAADVLGTGPRGIGFLESAFGVGSILGGFVALSRVSRGRLARDLAWGVLLWSVPLVLVTTVAVPLTCFAAMVLLGIGNPLVDVNLDTVIQRVSPAAALGRVFGALETCFISTMALGALAMPFLIDSLGLRLALLVVAAPVTALALAGWQELRQLDSRLQQPRGLPLLRAIDIFAPLPPAQLDSLARELEEVRVAAGDDAVREGGTSDCFYVIASGLVEVTQGSRVLRREGPGDYFGEIGLLRDVPRTATVTAVEDTVLLALARESFLAAVTGEQDSRRAAESMVRRRLAT